MGLQFKHTNESIEYPGHKCAYYKFIEPGDFRTDLQSLREKYESDGFQVLHVLTCFNTGIDWFSGKRVKQDEHGFEVVYK